MPWSTLVGVVAGLLLTWAVTVALLWRLRPGELQLREALHLLPDLAGLLARVARDHTTPRGVRVRLWLLLAYLAMPIDLVPDVIPVLGWADDAIVVVLTLRSVVRRAGPEVVAHHWRGSPAGLQAVLVLGGHPATREAS